MNIYDGKDGDVFTDWKFFASMSTMKEWPWFVNQQSINSDNIQGSTDVDPDLIRRSFKAFALKIARICSNLPMEILLLFKVNDFMRALNLKLGVNFNNFSIGLQKLNEIIYKHEVKLGKIDWFKY